MKNKDEKKIMVTSLVLLIVVLWTGNSATWAQPADPEEYQESATPEGYVLVEEDVLMMFTEAPGEQFHRANELFKAGQFKQCAEHIRRGAAYLKLQQARADIQGRRELEGAVKALDKLAQDVEFGKVNEASRLESAFARAHHALARHHKIKAERYQRQEAKDKLVKAMKAAGSHLESGFKWTGRQLDGGTRTVIRETKELPG
ncbi:MAG: hypothetical protein H8E73_10105, partial [Planctomycetes bacterium]|nr:hypothetical protein [Planctomycetota bacterium]